MSERRNEMVKKAMTGKKSKDCQHWKYFVINLRTDNIRAGPERRNKSAKIRAPKWYFYNSAEILSAENKRAKNDDSAEKK